MRRAHDRYWTLSTCQKAHSAAYATTARTKRDDFRWTRGDDIVTAYESSKGKHRFFCPRCGSHLMAERADQDEVVLRIASIDTHLTEKAAIHIWMSHEASWHETKDALPKFTQGWGSNQWPSALTE